jgi:hypothetical protein
MFRILLLLLLLLFSYVLIFDRLPIFSHKLFAMRLPKIPTKCNYILSFLSIRIQGTTALIPVILWL